MMVFKKLLFKDVPVGLLALHLLIPALTGCPARTEIVVEDEPVVTVRESVHDPDDLFSQAVEAMEAGEWEEAREELLLLLELAPNVTTARYNLGLTLQQLGELDLASEAYSQVLKERPDHLSAALNLAKVYREQERFREGIVVLETLLEDNPYEGRLLNNLSVLYRLEEDYDQAAALLRRLLSRDPDNPDAHKNLALIYYDQGRYRMAEFIMGTARQRNEEDPGIFNNLGMIAMKRGDLTVALGQFRRAVEIDPDFAPGHMNIGAVALRYRDYIAAADAFGEALRVQSTNWRAHLYRAYALEGAQEMERASEAYARVLQLRPRHPEAKYGLCKSLQNIQPERARGYCTAFVALDGVKSAQADDARQRVATIDMLLEIRESEQADLETAGSYDDDWDAASASDPIEEAHTDPEIADEAAKQTDDEDDAGTEDAAGEDGSHDEDGSGGQGNGDADEVAAL